MSPDRNACVGWSVLLSFNGDGRIAGATFVAPSGVAVATIPSAVVVAAAAAFERAGVLNDPGEPPVPGFSLPR